MAPKVPKVAPKVDLGQMRTYNATMSTREIAVARASTTTVRAEAPRRHSPIQNAFIRRTTHAIERLAAQADEATLVEAMAAPTDFGTLARALSDFGAIGTAVAEIDPEAIDLAHEIEHRETLVRRADGMLSAEEAGQLLHITRQAVDKRRRGRTLLAIRQGGIGSTHVPSSTSMRRFLACPTLLKPSRNQARGSLSNFSSPRTAFLMVLRHVKPSSGAERSASVL